MPELRSKNFNLPYQQYDSYWLILFSENGNFPANIASSLQEIGYRQSVNGAFIGQTMQDWSGLWGKTYAILQAAQLIDCVNVTITSDYSVVGGGGERKTVAAIQDIASSLWLGEALREDRVMCHFQPIIVGSTSNDSLKIFGYESFVRVRSISGEIIAGSTIIQACKAMNIEYMVDRLLHKQAIKTFATSDNVGFLFINFFTGFIQRPEIYLEGLRENAKLFGIVPKNIVLEFASCKTSNDIKHLKNVCDYAKMQGYSIALDDVISPHHAKKLINEIKPDFVKIDVQALGNLDNLTIWEDVRQILEITCVNGGSVIAEGVETEKSYEQLKSLGINLFQGYLFSAPAPLKTLL
jgi:EAL domain-containing protein (putative c-di-GMP-specific phosphodiesterase class I)